MEHPPSLAEILSQVPDPRQLSKGEHPLTALLLHSILATLCGCRGPTAIAQWGRLHPQLANELGYSGVQTPCAATFCRFFAKLSWELLVNALHQWAESWLQPREGAQREADSSSPPMGVALDGKTLRGSRQRGGAKCHVLTAVCHPLGLTLGEAAVDDKTNEIPVAKDLLKRFRLKGRVLTVDALLTQRDIAALIVQAQGDDVMPVKENHKAVYKELHTLFRRSERREVSLWTAQTVETNRGRLETRTRTAMGPTDAWGEKGWADYFPWPGLQQVYRLEREVTVLRTGKVSRQVEVGLTRLGVNATTLLAIRRGHGYIENGFHYVRDVTYDEDRSQVRIGNAPHGYGTLRNVAIALFGRHGRHNIAQATREIAAHPQRALAWLGIGHS